MTLANKYVFGTLIQGYEVEMLDEHLESCKQMLVGIDNPENVRFDFVIGMQEYVEKYDDKSDLWARINRKLGKFRASVGAKALFRAVADDDEFYNVARYRRDLCYNFAEKADFICWGETDSLWPDKTLHIIESLHAEVKNSTPKYLLTFAYRRNWDTSWDETVHPMYKDIPFVDTDEFTLHNEASEKAYMTLSRMNEINAIPIEEVVVEAFSEPKADGSCLVMTSDLIKSGVNIPHALIHNGEDESLCRMAKLVMGDSFVQYHIANILRVHNRRHPHKRTGLVGEDNPRGFCDDRKGKWWNVLERSSKFNLENLRRQVHFNTVEGVLAEIGSL